MKSTIEINIEELVLHGFSTADKLSMGLAVEQELTNLFNQQGVPAFIQDNQQVRLVNGGSFPLPANKSGATIGHQIAGAIYTGLQGE